MLDILSTAGSSNAVEMEGKQLGEVEMATKRLSIYKSYADPCASSHMACPCCASEHPGPLVDAVGRGRSSSVPDPEYDTPSDASLVAFDKHHSFCWVGLDKGSVWAQEAQGSCKASVCALLSNRSARENGLFKMPD